MEGRKLVLNRLQIRKRFFYFELELKAAFKLFVTGAVGGQRDLTLSFGTGLLLFLPAKRDLRRTERVMSCADESVFFFEKKVGRGRNKL